jgi:hypothetical protein
LHTLERIIKTYHRVVFLAAELTHHAIIISI